MVENIPGPMGMPLVGNMLDIWQDRDMPLRGLERLASIYGPIYQVTLGGKRRIICSSAALLEELTDEKRFSKIPPPQAISDADRPKGLFLARNEDPDWAQGHRILMPAFAPLSVHDMFDEMKDIAHQLVLSWARKGPHHRILATEDFTRLTLDTIALCTMDYRFNSFYTDSQHPFIEAMNFIFAENTARTTRPSIATKLMHKTQAQYDQAQALMRQVGQSIIDERRANPTDKKDVLNTMIHGKDPKTGQVMRDDLIMEQMITFLVAGHETTSGLLSFAIMYLLTNPATYLKAQLEVDEVVGSRAIDVQDLGKMKYLNAVLREAARLSPTVPVMQKEINAPQAGTPVHLAGRYEVQPTDTIVLLMSQAQRDPKVWGETADDFEPERMLDENFDRMSAQYPGAWKPFGNGKRACIGRPFAWQESLLVLAMVLQNFELALDDPNYKLEIKQALTIKPADLYIRATPRNNMRATDMDEALHSKGMNGTRVNGAPHANGDVDEVAGGEPLLVLYGSNTGTCQAFAQRLATDATAHGYKATVQDMDSATNKLPTDRPVVIITSSYEGLPPDNAARFVAWLESASGTPLEGVKYTVFGCGHKDWASTFHRIPKLTDEMMRKLGATPMAPVGSTDAAKGTLYSDFEEWLDNDLWTKISTSNAQSSVTPTHLEISTDARASSLRHDVSLATVTENRALTMDGEPLKCHMEIQLPSDVTYECGDYLAVLPLNSEKRVRQILAHFGLPWDAVATLKGDGMSGLPPNTPLSCFDVLRSYVELSQPATKKNLRTIASYTHDPCEQKTLTDMADNTAVFDKQIIQKRTSVFDVLTHYPRVELPFGEFLSMLPPLSIRQYSISSSPLHKPGFLTITYGVISRQAMSDATKVFEGVTGNYLTNLQAGDRIQVGVRATAKKTFRLPSDIANTPLLMFAAGTGLAPFRGFLQERALQKQAGRHLAPALLFLGCRSQTTDRLYADEIDAWAASGIVNIKYAFSKDTAASNGCKYVPDRMEYDSAELVEAWRNGGRAYICGTRQFANGVSEAAKAIAKRIRDDASLDDQVREEMNRKFTEAIQARLASDVFD